MDAADGGFEWRFLPGMAGKLGLLRLSGFLQLSVCWIPEQLSSHSPGVYGVDAVAASVCQSVFSRTFHLVSAQGGCCYAICDSHGSSLSLAPPFIPDGMP